MALSRLSLWVSPQTLFSFRNVSISPFFFYLSSSPFYTLVLASVLPKVDLNYTRLQQAEKVQMEAEAEDKKHLQECQSKSDNLQKQISQKEKQLWVFHSWKQILTPTPSFLHVMIGYLYFPLVDDDSYIMEFSLRNKKN